MDLISNYKKLIFIFLISISLVLCNWILSYNYFPYEDVNLRSINEFYDYSYFPLIKTFANLNFQPAFSETIHNSNYISFPILSLITNILFFKIFGSYSFIILEIICVFIFLVIFNLIFTLSGFKFKFSLFCSLLLFILPEIISDLSFFEIEYINKISTNFYTFYNLRIPRPLITNLFLFFFLYQLTKFYYLKIRDLKIFITIGIILGISLNTFFYFFIFELVLIFIIYIDLFKKNIFIYLSNFIKFHLITLLVVSIFAFIYFFQILNSEPDYIQRMGVFEVNFEKKIILIKYFINFITRYEFILLFFLNTFIFIKFNNDKIKIFYYFFISTVVSTIIFLIISNKTIDYYHFFNWIITSGLLYFSLSIFLFFNNLLNNKNSFFFKDYNFIIIIILMVSYFNISYNKNSFFDQKQDLKRKNLNELVNFISSSENLSIRNLEILTFNYELSVWLILNNYNNFNLAPSSFWVNKNNQTIENDLISSFKFLNLSSDDFIDFFENKKNKNRYQNKNTVAFFGRKYLANKVTTFADLSNYSTENQKIITMTSPLISHQIIIPLNELKRLKNKFTNYNSDLINPNVVILDNYDQIINKFNLKNNIYCLLFKNNDFTLYLKKEMDQECY